jgi:XapX domain-containing protein
MSNDKFNLKGMIYMSQVILAVFSGLIVGSLFSFLNLPIPAPPTITGVMGIFGIYLGFIITNMLF